MRDLRKERNSWLPLANFHSWQIFKLLSQKPMCVRDLIRAGFAGSYSTLTKTIRCLVQEGLVSREVSPRWPAENTLKLTEAGARVLACFDQIGEIVEERRRGWQTLEELPEELRGSSLEELREWYESDRREVKR